MRLTWKLTLAIALGIVLVLTLSAWVRKWGSGSLAKACAKDARRGGSEAASSALGAKSRKRVRKLAFGLERRAIAAPAAG